MKIMIMTDMEGVAGVLDHDEWVVRGGYCYAKGMRLLTEEVNAAICGLCAGGANEIVVVGQHAKAGTDCSHITHTQWFNYIDLSINGISIGEYGQFALCARELGVPVILACGEAARKSMRLLADCPQTFRFPKLDPPFVRIAKFRKQGDKPPHSARDEHPESVITLLNMPYCSI